MNCVMQFVALFYFRECPQYFINSVCFIHKKTSFFVSLLQGIRKTIIFEK